MNYIKFMIFISGVKEGKVKILGAYDWQGGLIKEVNQSTLVQLILYFISDKSWGS